MGCSTFGVSVDWGGVVGISGVPSGEERFEFEGLRFEGGTYRDRCDEDCWGVTGRFPRPSTEGGVVCGRTVGCVLDFGVKGEACFRSVDLGDGPGVVAFGCALGAV